MSWSRLKEKKDLLIEALQPVITKDHAMIIVEALDEWIEEKLIDLEDKIKERGVYDPDW